jgi:phosphotransferase system HPr-like phosphotransfer protein
MWKWRKKAPQPARVPSLEQQLEILAECGVKLRPGARIESLVNSFPRPQYERDPFRLALVVLGGEAEDSEEVPRPYLSDDVWHFDTECIEDHGAYARIAARMSTFAKGALPLADVTDHVDVEAGEAWLEFTLDGKRHHLDLKVNDDWVDESVFTKLVGLHAARGAPRRFSFVDLQGQDCLIGCPTPEEFERLRARTGIDVQWLK